METQPLVIQNNDDNLNIWTDGAKSQYLAKEVKSAK